MVNSLPAGTYHPAQGLLYSIHKKAFAPPEDTLNMQQKVSQILKKNFYNLEETLRATFVTHFCNFELKINDESLKLL